MVTPLRTPATTCALVSTCWGAKTKPEPSSVREQLGAVPTILTTLGLARSTPAAWATAGSGGGTLAGIWMHRVLAGCCALADGPASTGDGMLARRWMHPALAMCCLLAGGSPSGPVTAGMTMAIAAATAMPAAAPKARRRRSLMPARSALSATGPIGGSSARALSSSVRSVVSSMAAAPRLVLNCRHAGRSGFGHRLTQRYPQLVQGPGAELFDIARRAAQYLRHLIHAQVRPVAQHHHGTGPRRQSGQRFEQDHPGLRRRILGCALGKRRGEKLTSALQAPVGQVSIDEGAIGVSVRCVLPPNPAPGHEHFRQRRLRKILRGMPVTAQKERRTPQPWGHDARELGELLRWCHLTSAPPTANPPAGSAGGAAASMTGQ